MHGHFGNEQMWNVPTSISWADLDGSLVQGDLGGFDAYAADAASGVVVSRPSWAHKLTVYHRGVGTVEKRGYFIGAKFEEILTRRTRALGSAVLSPLSRSADRLAPLQPRGGAARGEVARAGLGGRRRRRQGAAAGGWCGAADGGEPVPQPPVD